MKKIWQTLTGQRSDVVKKKSSGTGTGVSNKELVGVPIEYQPIQSRENLQMGKELIGVPLGYSPMVFHSRSSPPRYRRSQSPPVQVQRRMNTSLNSPWNQLFAIDNTVESMKTRLELIDQDLSMAFDMLGIRRGRGKEEGATTKKKRRQNHVQMDWTSEGVYNVKVPIGSNMDSDSISVNLEHGTLVISFKNTEEVMEGKAVEEVTKKIPLPENVDSNKIRVIWKPEGYLHIEAQLLPEGRKESKANKTGKLSVQAEDKSSSTTPGKHQIQRHDEQTKMGRVSLEQDVNRYTTSGLKKDAKYTTGITGREDPRTVEYSKAAVDVTRGGIVKDKEALSPSAV